MNICVKSFCFPSTTHSSYPNSTDLITSTTITTNCCLTKFLYIGLLQKEWLMNSIYFHVQRNIITIGFWFLKTYIIDAKPTLMMKLIIISLHKPCFWDHLKIGHMYVLSKHYVNFAKCQAYLLTFGGPFIVIFCIICQICMKEFHNNGWKHITVTPFGVSHYITLHECACLSVSHLKLSKDFHNIFAYYVRL